MADIIIPAPDAAGYWHFTYVTTDTLDGRWYGGKRSTKQHPTSDRYLGSGNWIKKHPARDRLKREVVAFYPSSTEVFAAEAELVTWAVVLDDPLCMNLRDGGEGVSVEAALMRYADPARRAKHADDMRLMHADPVNRARIAAAGPKRAADPRWQKANLTHMRRITSDPILLAKARVSRETPEWRANVVAALEERRAADPDWRSKVKAGMLRVAADPRWQEARAAENRRMATDPSWIAAQAAGTAERNVNPTWRAAMKDAGKKRSESPAWRAAYDKGMEKRAANYAAKRAAKAESA